MKGFSKCCDAPIVNTFCSDCKEHTEPQKYDCDICEDTGEVSCDESDGEGHIQRGVGTQKCECRINNDDYDDQDD